MLKDWLGDAIGGHGRLIFIGGEAGVGKTALVSRFCDLARGRARVLRGVCDALSTPRPLGPLLDIAASVGGELDRLLSTGASRDAVFRSALNELSNGLTPTVMVIEDVQWADQATIDLIRFLGRRIEPARAMLLLTYRDDETGPSHPIRVALGDLATTPTTRRLNLMPLSEDGIAAMIAQHSAQNRFEPAALHRLTGGNPFFASEVLAGEQESGAVPATIRDAVLARISRLPPEEREALDAAAVADNPFTASLLEEITGLALTALETALASGMLTVNGNRMISFRHELARTAIYDAIPPARRRDLHARVLAALQSMPAYDGAWSQLASHAELAGNGAVVLQTAPEAAKRAASLRAHREAAAQYARAHRFSSTLPARDRADLLESLAYECYLTGEFEDAIRHQREALAIWRAAGDTLREGEGLRWISRFSWFTGRTGDAVAAADEALAVLEPLPPGRELAMALSNRSQLYMLADENHLAILWGMRAIAFAKTLDEVEIHIHALTNVGNARMRLGNEQGRADLERSLAMAQAADLEEHVARALTNLSCNALHDRDLPLAERYFAAGIEYTTEHDLDSWRQDLRAWRACLRMLEGDWTAAAADAIAVLESPNPAPITSIPALTVLGLVRHRLGERDTGGMLDVALQLADETGEIQRLRPVRIARAEAAWLTGNNGIAAAEVRTIVDLTLQRASRWEIGEVLVWLRRIDPDQAVEDLADLSTLPEPHRLALTGDWAGAAKAWTALGFRYEAALALLDGDEPALRQALAVFAQLGARPAEAIAAQRLRQLGARRIPRGPRPATLANPARLTPRELEILPLLINGNQNSEIADHLFLSVKTVGHHVSRILGKLGVRRRADVAAAAERHGIRLTIEQNREVATPN